MRSRSTFATVIIPLWLCGCGNNSLTDSKNNNANQDTETASPGSAQKPNEGSPASIGDAEATALTAMGIYADPTLMTRQFILQVQEQILFAGVAKTGIDDISAAEGLSRDAQSAQTSLNGIAFVGAPTFDPNGLVPPAEFMLKLTNTKSVYTDQFISGNANVSISLGDSANNNIFAASSTTTLDYNIDYPTAIDRADNVSTSTKTILQSTGSRASGRVTHLLSGATTRTHTSVISPNDRSFVYVVSNNNTRVDDTFTYSLGQNANTQSLYTLQERTLNGSAAITSKDTRNAATIHLSNLKFSSSANCLCPISGSVDAILFQGDANSTYASYDFSSGNCGSVYLYLATASAPQNDASTYPIPYPLSVGDTLHNGSIVSAVKVTKMTWNNCQR